MRLGKLGKGWMRLGKLGKGWMSGEMVEGQSSFAINHGNRQKAEWALAFSQEGQAQSNSLSRQPVISNIETFFEAQIH